MKRALIIVVAVCACVTKKPDPWLTDETAAFTKAREQKKAVLIDFSATYSIPSDEISHLLDESLTRIDRDFVRLRIDVSNEDDRVAALRVRYNANVLPMVMFVDTDGTVLGRINSMQTKATLDEALAAAAKKRAKYLNP